MSIMAPFKFKIKFCLCVCSSTSVHSPSFSKIVQANRFEVKMNDVIGKMLYHFLNFFFCS